MKWHSLPESLFESELFIDIFLAELNETNTEVMVTLRST